MKQPLHSSSFRAFLAAVALTGCSRDLSLPSIPSVLMVPAIEELVPPVAFGGDTIEIRGSGFDPKAANNEVRFEGGFAARAFFAEEDALWVSIPAGLSRTGPVVVATPQGTSASSLQDFVPIGDGHPTLGTPVADIRLRHRPAGLLNRPDSMLLASTLFDVVVSDVGAFSRVGGRPVSFVRATESDRGWLSVRTAMGGRFLELDATTAERLAVSEEDSRIERFVLAAPARAPGEPRVRTLGEDLHGGWWVSAWAREGAALVPERRPLAVKDVLGAAASLDGRAVYAVVTLVEAGRTKVGLLHLGPTGDTLLWTASPGAEPIGPLAIIPMPEGPLAALALADGDLALVPLDGRPWRRKVMTSYALIGSICAGLEPGKIVLTKPQDGALYLYDAAFDEVDWTVQLRGEPGLLDVSAEANEISVANLQENAVDVVDATSGQWLGRVSFNLGLGSVDGGDGGAVAPYSYRPSDPVRPNNVQILARNAGLVLNLDPDALQVFDWVQLDAEASGARRLVLLPDLHVLVVHRQELGLLEETEERIVLRGLESEPTAVVMLPSGWLALGTPVCVNLYDWTGELPVLASSLPLPDGALLEGLAAVGDEVMVVWKGAGGFGGGIFAMTEVRAGGVPRATLNIDASLGDLIGVSMLVDGPALSFARSARPGPALVTFPELLGEGRLLASVAVGPRVTRATPDGRYALWSDDDNGEDVLRVLRYEPGTGLVPFTSYHLPSDAAGAALDPSGTWLYVPIPGVDMISVMQ